jgi:type I restriction enzyme R subunit
MELKGVLNGRRRIARAKAEQEMAGRRGRPNWPRVLREMAKRGRQPNLSFFAFTATPKYKTLEFSTSRRTAKPFHRYTMRQAIEEGFILDVLKNYVTYEDLLQAAARRRGRPAMSSARRRPRRWPASCACTRTNIAQKTEVMVEHFRTHVRHKIGGRAKAMVVTEARACMRCATSRTFDRYIAEQGYPTSRAWWPFPARSKTRTPPARPGPKSA